MNVLRWVLFCVCLISSSLVFAETGSELDSFQVWKGGDFHRFVVNKSTGFAKYSKLLFFPMNSKEFFISEKAKKRLKRSWADFKDEELPAINQKFLKLVDKEFNSSKAFTLVQKGGNNVLAIEFRALEFLPRAFRGSSLSTVGQEDIESYGVLQYRLVLVDAKTRSLVGLIDDHLPINLKRKSVNNRAMLNRAFHLSLAYILEQLHANLQELAVDTPLIKS